MQEKVRKNVQAFPNIQVINAAVGPSTDIAKFYVTENWKASSSLLPFDKEAADKVVCPPFRFIIYFTCHL